MKLKPHPLWVFGMFAGDHAGSSLLESRVDDDGYARTYMIKDAEEWLENLNIECFLLTRIYYVASADWVTEHLGLMIKPFLSECLELEFKEKSDEVLFKLTWG